MQVLRAIDLGRKDGPQPRSSLVWDDRIRQDAGRVIDATQCGLVVGDGRTRRMRARGIEPHNLHRRRRRGGAHLPLVVAAVASARGCGKELVEGRSLCPSHGSAARREDDPIGALPL